MKNLDDFDFSTLPDQVEKNNGVLEQALNTDPQQFTKAIEISKSTGIPAKAVTGHEKKLQTLSKLRNLDFSDSPVTTQFTNNFENAVVAQNDFEKLKVLESKLKIEQPGNVRFGDAFMRGATSFRESFLRKTYRSETHRINELLLADDETILESLNAIKSNPVEIGGNGVLKPLLKDIPVEDRKEFIDNIGVDEYKSAMVERLNNYLQLQYQSIDRSKDAEQKYGKTGDYTIDRLFDDFTVKNTAGFILESGVESIPEMLTAMTGVGLIPVAVSSGGRVAESRAENNDVPVIGGVTKRDDDIGSLAGVAVASLEKLGIDKALLKKGGVETLRDVPLETFKRIFIEGSTEALGEVVETLGGSVDTVAGVSKEDLLKSAVGGFLSGTGVAGTINTVRVPMELVEAARSKTKEIIDTQQTVENEQRKIDDIVEVVQEMELKQLSPEKLREFVEQSDGDQNTTIFLKTENIKEYIESLDESDINNDPGLSSLVTKMREAVALNSDIDIPIADFVTDFVGSDHFESLRPHMTIKSETPTVDQMEQRVAEAQSYVDELIASASQEVESSIEADQIYQDVKEQLIDTGRLSERDAKVAAQLVPAWATAFAKQNGISVSDAFAQAGLTITGTQTGKKEKLKNAGVLKQKVNGYYDDKNTTIVLTENSDASTFIHEFGHFVYDMERRTTGKNLSGINQWFSSNIESLASESGLSPSQVKDYIDNNTTGDEALDKKIYKATHEQFARAFETYLMEGKSPSIELRDVFRTIARWMVEVYRAIKGDLDVNLNDNMRQVFDRMLATEDQIAAAQARSEFAPLFSEAVMAGKTQEEYDAYKKTSDNANNKAKETLREKLINEITREQKRWWKQQKDDLIIEETKKLEKERVHKARNALTSDKIKINTGDVRSVLDLQKGRLPRQLSKMHSPDGMEADQAATILGYVSGDEMINDIINMPTLKAAAADAAQKRMVEEHGDLLNDGSIEAAADDALQNEERGKLLLEELRSLAKLNKTTSPIDRKMIKKLAEENIAKLSYSQIHPSKYRSAEIKAAKEAAVALKDKDASKAMVAKTRQIMNYYLGMEATKAKQKIEKIVEHKSRYRKKSVREEIMRGDAGHLDQIEKILKRFDFRKTAPMNNPKETLSEFVAARAFDFGETIQTSQFAIDESNTTHWKNVTFNDLQGVDDTVRSLEHVARQASKIKLGEETLAFNETIDKFTNRLSKLKKVFNFDTRLKPGDKQKANGVISSLLFKSNDVRQKYLSDLSKMPWVASWLDNHERAGLAHELLIQPMVDGYNRVQELHEQVSEPIGQTIKRMTKGNMKRYEKIYHIPELVTDTDDGNLNGMNVLSVMLNMGNESNLRKMLLGEGWANADDETTINHNNEKLQAIFKKFKPTKQDWDLVQTIWDNTNKLYDPMVETYKAESGLAAPQKIEPMKIKTPFGTYDGGFYPIKYDPNRSPDAEKQSEREAALLESSFSLTGSLNPSVNARTTNERTGFYAPIDLNISVLDNHIKETIHYIGLAEPVRQVNRILSDKKVSGLLKEKLGEHEYSQIKPWLRRIAKNGHGTGALDKQPFFNRFAGRFRRGLTFTYLGFKASTGLMQAAGLANTINETGGGNTLRALKYIISGNGTNPVDSARNSFNEAIELGSKVLPNRVKTFDREISEASQKIKGNNDFLSNMQRASMWHIGFMQLWGVDVITWRAAYEKELVLSGDQKKAVRYADWAVENIQGSSTMFNLSNFQASDNEVLRTYYAFSTFAATQLNQQRDVLRRFKDNEITVAGLAGAFATIIMLPTVYEAWVKGVLDLEDEESNKKLAWRMVDTSLMGVPVVRDVSSLAQGYGFSTPMMSLIDKGGKATMKMLKDGDATASEAKRSSLLALTLLNAPGGSQAWVTGESLYKWVKEGEDITMSELLITGPEK